MGGRATCRRAHRCHAVTAGWAAKAAADSARRFKEADNLKQESAKKDVMARQALTSASEHLEQAQARWQQLLDQSPFDSEQAVLEAAIPADEAERLAAEIQHHRERERELVSQLRELEQKLVVQKCPKNSG